MINGDGHVELARLMSPLATLPQELGDWFVGSLGPE
jgi:hypothetical protein